ncbi:hypothetical protein LIER_44010 [Lithospermum erythrorhizon]|uniref:Uncharacterized protein n=1 Tax=Lithospermum erythrorhizon TaxID=34254 RepID=A0AAV3RJF8_LITER
MGIGGLGNGLIHRFRLGNGPSGLRYGLGRGLSRFSGLSYGLSNGLKLGLNHWATGLGRFSGLSCGLGGFSGLSCGLSYGLLLGLNHWATGLSGLRGLDQGQRRLFDIQSGGRRRGLRGRGLRVGEVERRGRRLRRRRLRRVSQTGPGLDDGFLREGGEELRCGWEKLRRRDLAGRWGLQAEQRLGEAEGNRGGRGTWSKGCWRGIGDGEACEWSRVWERVTCGWLELKDAGIWREGATTPGRRRPERGLISGHRATGDERRRPLTKKRAR